MNKIFLDTDQFEQVVIPSMGIPSKNLLAIKHIGDESCITPLLDTLRNYLICELRQKGAILLRDFPISNVTDFETAVRRIDSNFDNFDEESSPRHSVKEFVNTATDYPGKYPIQFHNEFSYSNSWPMNIFFYCQQPSSQGGQTPIADSRYVLSRISTNTKERFREKGILYHRRYFPYSGVSWQSAFRTENRDEVLECCRDSGITARWTGDVLYTTQPGSAIVTHPETKEAVWFNHGFFFNPLSLEPIALRTAVLEQSKEEMATYTTYGDGSPIEKETIEEIREAYNREKIVFDWEAGDILIIDNMLSAHAREPYGGNRELYVMMTSKYYRSSLVCSSHAN